MVGSGCYSIIEMSYANHTKIKTQDIFVIIQFGRSNPQGKRLLIPTRAKEIPKLPATGVKAVVVQV